MFSWNDKSIQWFLKACLNTSFYKDIVAHVLPLLSPEDRVLEIGCGIGALSLELAPNVHSVEALDVNDSILHAFQTQVAEKGIANVFPIQADWQKYHPASPYDIVFLCYCNGMAQKDTLEKLMSLTRKKVIAILPEYDRDTNFYIESFISPQFKKIYREKISDAIDFLKKMGVPYTFIKHHCRFDQPIENYEEYKEFMNYYFNITDEQILNKHADLYLKKNENGYCLANERQSGIIIIDKYNI